MVDVVVVLCDEPEMVIRYGPPYSSISVWSTRPGKKQPGKVWLTTLSEKAKE